MTKRLFSGIQPSGNLHLGNYLGALKQWVDMQNDHEAIFCIVDLHAITVPQDPAELRAKTLEIAKIYLASGIDPTKSTLFIQSHVSAHAELGWILNTITKNGDLTKMTQFKGKSGVDADEFEQLLREMITEKPGKEVYLALTEMSKEQILENANAAAFTAAADFFKKFKTGFNSVSVGLSDYPVLMAADILLYDTNVVPVGDDQLQHIELARDLAERFNKRFGETFIIPEGKITKEGARIMGLDDPTKKMSKSAASEYNYIALTDDADTVRRKIKKAVTDSGSEIVYADDKPALKNLINIYTLLSGKTPQEIQAMYVGKGYGDFKTDLAEVVVSFLSPFQERLAALSDEEVLAILKVGAEKVRPLAEAKLRQVYEKIGIISH
jgi:tryptophanyl-tRNA synthetase